MKIGFACKYKEPSHLSKKAIQDKEKEFNFRGTTATYMRKLSEREKHNKLEELVFHNLNALDKQINYVRNLPKNLHMMRIGSDLLPYYTHSEIEYLYDKEIKNKVRTRLKTICRQAKQAGIRLSFHPGQFCILNSMRRDVLENTIKEIEYHTLLANWMGYEDWHEDDFVINIHTGGKEGGIENFRKGFKRLSRNSQNLLTVENEETCFSIDDLLPLADTLPLVLDIHHHWIKTGEYFQPSDSRWAEIQKSWGDKRPKIHYSLSSETLLEDKNTLPDMNKLLECGYNKQKLRAHSDFCWHYAGNDWALGFLNTADIMCEMKQKNLASMQLYNHWRSKWAR